MGLIDYMQRAKRHNKRIKPSSPIFAEGVEEDTYRLSFPELLKWEHTMDKT